MNKKLFLILFLLPCFLQAQIAAGPMLGYTELRTARVWVQYEPSQDLKEVKYEIEPHYLFVSNEKSLPEPEIETEILDYKHKIVMIHFNNLQPGVTYHYAISTFKNKVVKKITTVKKKKIEHSSIVREPVKVTGNFQTQELWQFRKQAPDFGFITGSCNYVNQTVYDRPGKPYGGDSIIFNSMTKELEANFMLWLGDNWYTREADYFSAWGLFTRAEYDRNKKIMQPLFKRMPQYAIWDDHDYGFNDGDKSYFLKKESRDVFKTFWANPTYGENNEGIYSRLQYNDVVFFLLDDRSFRSNDYLSDSINGQPNKDKKLLGDKQMEWLKNNLVSANNSPSITFKIIVLGSQVLNPVSPYDCYYHFPYELDELKAFLLQEKINGVVFLTGDRHHSEIIKIERENAYPLYDITCSPLTSGTHTFSGTEANNPYRIIGLDKIQNYTLFRFIGDGKNRLMQVIYKDKFGELQKQWQIRIKDISFVN